MNINTLISQYKDALRMYPEYADYYQPKLVDLKKERDE